MAARVSGMGAEAILPRMSHWLEVQWHLINSERKHLTFRNLVGVHEAQNNGLIQPGPPVLTWRWGRGHTGRLFKKN